MYPTTIPRTGLQRSFVDGGYDGLRAALEDALEVDPTGQPPVARALLQADLWATYDFLAEAGAWPRGGDHVEQVRTLLWLLAQLIAKIALEPNEILPLPDNYALSMDRLSLPHLFSDGGGWIELDTAYPRFHEGELGYRRITRVFIRVGAAPPVRKAFAEDLEGFGIHEGDIEAAVLLLQNLVIAQDGSIMATPITYDVQIRRFERNEEGRVIGSQVEKFELSRRLTLQSPVSGGLVQIEDGAVYLPIAGNDFGFATPHESSTPIRSTVRQNCGVCHRFPNTDRFFSMETPHANTSRRKEQTRGLQGSRSEILADYIISRNRYGELIDAVKREE